MNLTTRAAALEVRCPACNSEPGVKRSGLRGPRESAHAERHQAAIRSGATPIERHHGPARPQMVASQRTRRPRRKQARWNLDPFTCAGCARRFRIATIRSVRHDDDEWCDSCYRKTAGVT